MSSSNSGSLFPPLLLPLLLLVQPSFQDLSNSVPSPCGGSSLQIDPTRPNNVIVAGLNPSPGGNRYQLVNMDLLVRNVCDLAVPSSELMAKVPPGRFLITRCDDCARCPQELPNLYRALVQISNEAQPKIASLLVILAKELDRPRPGLRQFDNSSPVKFLFHSNDEDPGVLTLCDSSDLGDGESLKSFSKTSVLFVSISFIILIVISLAWLVFYYVQRFRYAHAKDRLQRRLFNAAKKALARIPTRPVKAGDKELCSDCPVCIDPYKPGDICRQLPCRHIFHKSCVDPWLLEHRTCPMCKSDILKAFGYHVGGRRRAQFSANVEEDGPTGEHDLHRDGDRMSLGSTGSESANPFPVVTEVHDPFGFSPSTSPQLVQMVNNADFQIIPLAVQGQNPHCEIIQAPIERHSIADVDEPATSEAPLGQRNCPPENVVEQKKAHVGGGGGREREYNGERQQPQSAGLRLFRAVTGRRHVNANLVQIARSRSFSQSQISPTKLEMMGEAGGDGTTTKAIIYSVNSDDESIQPGQEAKQQQQNGNGNGKSAAKGLLESRAVTAPSGGGFRRKNGGSSSSQSRQGKAGENGQRAETRVDMNGTL